MNVAAKNLSPLHNTELLSTLADGNQATFKFIYNTYRHRIWTIAIRYLKSEVLAEEVVQEVFMKLWSEREKIKPETPVEAWLYTVAKNNTINRLKKKAIEWKAENYLKVTQDSYDESTLNKINDAECQRLLNKALKSLSENQRKVFKLAREEDCSYMEIATQLKISPLTVKTHMARALASLKLFFAPY
jgi:RNA polymerase sigma-70 factor (ECF subfamily)